VIGEDGLSAADRRFQQFLEQAAERLENPNSAPMQPWEAAAKSLSGTGARTGFGRRLFQGDYDTHWDEDVAYPQIAPSSTTNEARPRTLEMGYDSTSRIVMVTFRDGTVWQYYNVPPDVFADFALDPSPGRYIREVLDSYPYGRAPDKFQRS